MLAFNNPNDPLFTQVITNYNNAYMLVINAVANPQIGPGILQGLIQNLDLHLTNVRSNAPPVWLIQNTLAFNADLAFLNQQRVANRLPHSMVQPLPLPPVLQAPQLIPPAPLNNNAPGPGMAQYSIKATKLVFFAGGIGLTAWGINGASAGASLLSTAGKKTVQEIGKHGVKQFFTEGGKKVLEEVGKMAAEKLGEEVTKKVLEEGGKQLAIELGKQALTQATKTVAIETTTKIIPGITIAMKTNPTNN